MARHKTRSTTRRTRTVSIHIKQSLAIIPSSTRGSIEMNREGENDENPGDRRGRIYRLTPL
jgi:hypothetical protein